MLSLPDQTDRIQHDIKLLTSESIRKKDISLRIRHVA